MVISEAASSDRDDTALMVDVRRAYFHAKAMRSVFMAGEDGGVVRQTQFISMRNCGTRERTRQQVPRADSDSNGDIDWPFTRSQTQTANATRRHIVRKSACATRTSDSASYDVQQHKTIIAILGALAMLTTFTSSPHRSVCLAAEDRETDALCF